MAVQTKHRFSVEDYHRMVETGVLRPDARVELLDGEIIDMPPIGPFHSSVVNELVRVFNESSKGRWLVWSQNPISLDQHSEPQPDLMLVKPSADRYRAKHPRPADVFLLVEVSDTTLDLDRNEKLSTYGRAGVPEVWSVNLLEHTIEVYREPNFPGYGAKTVARTDGHAKPQTFPDVVVDVAELLKQ